ncbi:MAG: 1-deoxy-D-xylulose-5-phosphate reductoisomerase [Candidatus Omnitrophica bacterium]|nr:1-deoxy-D-xylulose-5-phosphate reductoisomerase [Candidatus Omnitrophota bacterium]MBU4479660.1 1-deoxy-D-xylulose-5-phosphate reductoisomerase [Candidatus Omnitrophota bacterium]MCG2703660.1 1-deoxy-D-xylulose-5-phosphate reductoisomerase [Candidatus Omnitrophota bacterium]
MKKIAILGSTGSIGTNALRIVREKPEEYRVIGLSAYRNVQLLARQIKLFKPKLISVKDVQGIKQLKVLVNLKGIKVFVQADGLGEIATHKEVERLVVATAGTISLVPVLEAIKAGKIIALANKEPLVMAGEIVMDAVRRKKGMIIPVDSEHSAIFQCLRKEDIRSLKRIYLTGTGGPFRNATRKYIRQAGPETALCHPKWKMGKKITIDSATLMNKGLELIEARWLFSVPEEKIEVLIHPEAVIHSMVEFNDRSVIAQMGIADMRLPIQYALDYPERKTNNLNELDFVKLKKLHFFKPDVKRFPCLAIAQKVARAGGSCGCVMNAANEIAVEAFLAKKIGFMDIPRVINSVLDKHIYAPHPNLEEILALDEWARKEAWALCYRL